MEKLISSALGAATLAHATRRLRPSTIGLGAILVMTAPLNWSSPGLAQTVVANQPTATAQCVVRTFKDADHVDRPEKLVIPSAEANDYAALGFTPTACGTIDVATYRDQMCNLATFGNDAVQNRLAQVLGARPDKMCASAKLVAASSLSIFDPTMAVSDTTAGSDTTTARADTAVTDPGAHTSSANSAISAP